jgi:hypothetical protein
MIKRICKHFRFLHFITISEERKKKEKRRWAQLIFAYNIMQEGLINKIGVIRELVQSIGSFTLQKVQKSLYLAGIFYQAYY